MATPADVKALVDAELAEIEDPRLARRIRELLVVPYGVERAWDYGKPGERFICWTVLEHRPSNTVIAYCDKGFGPGSPWGVVALAGTHMSIGMDAAWFRSLEDAMRESMAWDGPNPEGYEVG